MERRRVYTHTGRISGVPSPSCDGGRAAMAMAFSQASCRRVKESSLSTHALIFSLALLVSAWSLPEMMAGAGAAALRAPRL